MRPATIVARAFDKLKKNVNRLFRVSYVYYGEKRIRHL